MARKKKERPIIEDELQALQKNYLADRNPENFKAFYFRLCDYLKGLTQSKLKDKAYIEPTHLDCMVYHGVDNFFKKYLDPNFNVDYSFGGFLQYKAREILYSGGEVSTVRFKADDISFEQKIDYFQLNGQIVSGKYKDLEDELFNSVIDASHDLFNEIYESKKDLLWHEFMFERENPKEYIQSLLILNQVFFMNQKELFKYADNSSRSAEDLFVKRKSLDLIFGEDGTKIGKKDNS